MAVCGLGCYVYGEKMYADGKKAARDFVGAQVKGPIGGDLKPHLGPIVSLMFGVFGTSKEQQELYKRQPEEQQELDKK